MDFTETPEMVLGRDRLDLGVGSGEASDGDGLRVGGVEERRCLGEELEGRRRVGSIRYWCRGGLGGRLGV